MASKTSVYQSAYENVFNFARICLVEHQAWCNYSRGLPDINDNTEMSLNGEESGTHSEYLRWIGSIGFSSGLINGKFD